ncbi:MAG: hypothetical protein EGQ60_04605 [Clostridiales bacterium]|nr:hypothetical protein [Clostridiales bacterium]
MQANVLRFAKKPAPTHGSVTLPGWGLVLFLDQNLDRAGQGTIRAIKGNSMFTIIGILHKQSNVSVYGHLKNMGVPILRVSYGNLGRARACIIEKNEVMMIASWLSPVCIIIIERFSATKNKLITKTG